MNLKGTLRISSNIYDYLWMDSWISLNLFHQNGIYFIRKCGTMDIMDSHISTHILTWQISNTTQSTWYCTYGLLLSHNAQISDVPRLYVVGKLQSQYLVCQVTNHKCLRCYVLWPRYKFQCLMLCVMTKSQITMSEVLYLVAKSF